MTEKTFDVVGIGNAIVDILAYQDDTFLERFNLPKGSMTLVDEKQAKKLYAAMGAATECSGGSVANTMAGLAMLGAKGVFIGKVKDDQLGDIFRHDIKRSGLHYETPPAKKGKPTAHCLIFVTKKEGKLSKKVAAERTMATYLGASTDVGPEDINEDLVRKSKIAYFEGYLWDQEAARNGCLKAMRTANEEGVKVAFSLSDSLCVERHQEEFLDLIENHVDILFANEKEIAALLEESNVSKILYHMNGKCEITVVTRSEKGSYVMIGEKIYSIEAERIEDIYDVTGAGDLYASGFLYGLVNNFEPEKCAKLGSLCAAEVIRYLGGRPPTDLKLLLEKL